VPTSSPQATRLRFPLSCKMSFTKFEPHRDNPSLAFRNPYNLRESQSLNQSPWIRGRRRILSLREKYYNWRSLKILYWICKCFGQGILFESYKMIWYWEDKTICSGKLWGISCPKSPIYRPLMTIQKLLEQMWLLGVIFENSLLVIDYTNVVIDYRL